MTETHHIQYGGNASVGEARAGIGALSTTWGPTRASPKRRPPVASKRMQSPRSQYPRSGKKRKMSDQVAPERDGKSSKSQIGRASSQNSGSTRPASRLRNRRRMG